MRHRVRTGRNAVSLECAWVVLLSCVFAVLCVAHPARAVALGSGDGEAVSSEYAATAAGEASAGALGAQGQGEPIASGEIGTCVWEIDANGVLVLAPANGDEGTLDFYNPASSDPDAISSADHRAPWFPYASTITSAKVEGSITVTGYTCRMFWECRNMTNVDLSGLDISQVSYFGDMFDNCFKLVSVDMSMLDAPSAINTRNMFVSCMKLQDVKLPDFSDAKLKYIGAMFEHCQSLVTLDLSSIDTANVQDARYLFYGCTSLQKVIVGDKWDLPNCKSPYASDFESVFDNCRALVGQNGTSWLSTQFNDASYARVDTADAPGYFWLSGSDAEGGNSPGEGSGSSEASSSSSSSSSSSVSEKDDEPSESPGQSSSASSSSTSSKPSSSATSSASDKPSSSAASSASDKPSGSATSASASKSSSASSTKSSSASSAQPANSTSSASSGKSKSGTASKSSSASSAPSSSASSDSQKQPKSTSAAKDPAKQTKRTSIAKASIKLSASKYTYNGKVRTPSVKVALGGKKLKAGRDYTVKYQKGRKKIGTYRVTVTGKGAYRSKAQKSFTVIPATPKLKSLKAHKNSNGSSGFIAVWEDAANKVDGYQMRWSPSSSFKAADNFTFPADMEYAEKGAVALQVRTVAWLGKPVYVHMRAFKTVGGKTYYSNWSKVKQVRLKR